MEGLLTDDENVGITFVYEIGMYSHMAVRRTLDSISENKVKDNVGAMQNGIEALQAMEDVITIILQKMEKMPTATTTTIKRQVVLA